MLEKVRKPGRAKNFFAYILFGAIVLVFVFMGVTPDQGPFTTGGSAAVVNGQIISLAQYQRRLMAVEEQQQRQLQSLPEEQRQMRLQQMRSDVLEQMIVHELSGAIAERDRFKVADAEVRKQIVENSVFQDEDGRFRREYYQQILQANGWTSAEYEKLLRRDILLSRLQELFSYALLPIPGQLERDEVLRGSTVNLGFVNFDRDSLRSTLPVTSAQIQGFLNQEDSESQLQSEYQSRQSEFRSPAQVRARHILISAEAPEEETMALEKAMALREELTLENFADLAQQHSQDPGSASRGGDLGFFRRGQMQPSFEQAAFDLPIGEISQPIQTDFGYHLILVEEKQPESVQGFAEVKEQLARQVVQRELVDEELAQLESLAQASNEKALLSRIEQMGLSWSETGPFDLTRREIPKLGEADSLWNAVLERGESGLIPQLVVSRGRYHLLNVKEMKVGGSGLSPLDVPGSAQFFAMFRTGQIFESWLDYEKSQAKIQRNAQLLMTR